MHSAHPGPGLLARTARRLAPLLAVVRVLRRTRVLPVVLSALTLGIIALAAPIAPYDDDARSTTALTAGTESGLVPATGDWTQDGVPAPSSPSSSSSPSSRSTTGGTASSAADRATGEPSSAVASPAGTSSAATSVSSSSAAERPSASSTSSSSSSTSPSTSPSSSPSSSSTPRPPTPGADRSPAPVETPPVTPEAETPAVGPSEQVLGIVNAAREAAGCGALSPDPALAALAAAHVGADLPALGGRTALTATGTDPAEVGAAWAADAGALDCGLTAAGTATSDGSWLLLAA